MKKFFKIMLLFIATISVSLSFAIYNNTSEDIISEISAAIKSGNAANVSKYFNTTIDLTVPSGEGTFSKTQAEQILKDFFTKNPPKTFTINHQGASNDGSLFAIGTYVSGSTSYRSYFLLKKVAAGYCIQQLEFEVD
jgi:hypothetical protein